MKIILRGGPHNGEQYTVADDCRLFHRQQSSYEETGETESGRQIFRFKVKESGGTKPELRLTN